MTRAVFDRPPDTLDRLLTLLYLIGVYLGISLQLPGNLPLPAAIAGVAGLAMAMKQVPYARGSTFAAIAAVVMLAALSILVAPDAGLLGERFKGLVQFCYSLVIAIGFYLTARKFSARTLAHVFLAGAMAILIIATLETYVPAVKALCDSFRSWAFDFGVYAADLRDQILYGRVRPKALTSEPSLAAFGYLLLAFGWYALSDVRLKIFPFIALLAAGFIVLRAPTLLLGAPLAGAYWVFLTSRTGAPGHRHLDLARVAIAVGIAVGIAALAIVAGSETLGARIDNIAAGRDPSFFARIIAPPIVAFRTVIAHPLAGAGLAGWEFIDNTVSDIFANSSLLSMRFGFDSAAHSITNYFWLHWIFFGLFFGALMIVALSCLLVTLNVPSVAFCWVVWAILGQSAGGYVTPRTWCIFLFAAVIATVYERTKIERLSVPYDMPHRDWASYPHVQRFRGVG